MGVPDQVSSDVVEIRQPNDESLVVASTPEEGGSGGFVLSRRNGDFDCGKNGVEFSKRGSVGTDGGRALQYLSLQVAHSGNSRSFRRAEDGSLVMTVEEKFRDWAIFAVVGKTSTAHVRWVAKKTPADVR
jgi:hypothetical protein